MPLIEAALAFAITMLALSLIVSSFVEIIHRTGKMRERGLEYMLEQLFDQVLVKYLEPLWNEARTTAKKGIDDARTRLEDKKREIAGDPALDTDANKKLLAELEAGVSQAEISARKILESAYKDVRDGFVERMTANRVPVGLKADLRLAAVLGEHAPRPGLRLGNLWGGRRVTSLTPTNFMERLGSHGVGDAIRAAVSKAPADTIAGVVRDVGSIDLDREIKDGVAAGKSPEQAAIDVLKDITDKFGKIDLRKEISDAATAAGTGAADSLNTVLTDIAQKFDGFGKDAATYFEGRARFLSCAVAIVLAFAVHVDAIDLFRSYFRDPNARAKVIEQAQAITAQYESARKNIDSLGELEKAKNKEMAEKLAEAQKQGASPPPVDPQAAAAAATAATDAARSAADAKAQVEKLRKDALDAIDKTNDTVKSFAGVGVPLGWTKERWDNAGMYELVWSCKKVKDGIAPVSWKLGRECEIIQPPEEKGRPKPAARTQLERGVDYTAWFGIPSDLSVILYLLLGGLLIGLGSPFWYDAVIGLTNIRSMASGTSSSAPPKAATDATAGAAHAADKAQPVTPVGAFQVSIKASDTAKK